MKKLIILIVSVFTLLSNQGSRAQQFNMLPAPVDKNISIGLKVNKPFFKKTEYYENPGGASGVYKFYGYFPLKKNWQINTEIPLVIADMGETTKTGLGNLYVELQKALNDNKATWLAFGLYVPSIGTENYEKMFVGFLSDPYRFLQYEEGFTLNSTFGYNLRETPGILFGVEMGPDIFIPTTEGGDVELLMHYGIKGGYRFRTVSAWTELSGILIVTEEGSLDDKWMNQLFFGAQLNQGMFRPGIFYGFHLDKYIRDELSGVLGLNLQFVLK